MTITGERGVGASRSYKVVGTSPIRHDGVDKVTGRARYGADINMAGLLHGKILRSPHAHARIRSIDTSKAEALPGVRAVATAKDFPIVQMQELDFGGAQRNSRMMADNDLAYRKVLYQGHAVAAVAATSPHIAEEALELIKVDYEILPTVLTWKDAMKENAPLLHESLTKRFTMDRSSQGKDTGVRSNVASQIQFKLGDIEQGFREADVTVEREFTTQTVHQGYIEPFACTASWGPDGRVTIWTSTQGIFGIRETVAGIMDIAESAVKVVPMEVGGAFGGKGIGYMEPVAAVLSKKSGHPVKMVMSRKEVFLGTGPTSAAFMRCKIGADKSGKITAAKLHLVYEAGAYPGSPVGGGASTGLSAYKIDNVLIDGYDVVCNKQKTQAYRAPGHPQAAFAVEQVLDELAEKLGMDPMDLRLKNVARQGDRAPTGVPHARVGFKEVMEAMKAHPHYSAPLEGINRGRGIAVGYRLNGGGSGSSATINVNADGTVNVITGSMDLSGTRVSIAMQVAEVLGIAAEDVLPQVVDTDSVGWTGGSGGSRITFDTGRAAISGAEDVLRKMAQRAALLWDVQAEDVQFKDGVFFCAKNPKDKLSFKELAGKLMATGGPVTCSAMDKQGGVGAQLAGNIVDVKVDPETGKVDILRYTAFLDVGKAVHPAYVEGQIQGGTLQGIGWALNEEYFFTPAGAMANSSFLDYRMPTTLDLPMIEAVIIEVANPRHPFGVRGVGEGPIVPPLAAVANAVYRATGARMYGLPMSPGAILEAVEEQQPKKR
ncbi:MAG: xanthine dehydrogenase family protein molybdopterin-binding subunit [Dehalococcoidia bacterium]|nr:xanthine dehydrogenase family protein molybdopterin-binding subunit [Dehalococcoidia bacterium]